MSARWAVLRSSTRGAAAALAASSAATLAAPAEAQCEEGADPMGAVMLTTIASLLATEYVMQVLEQSLDSGFPASTAASTAPPPRPAAAPSGLSVKLQPASKLPAAPPAGASRPAVSAVQQKPMPAEPPPAEPLPLPGAVSVWPLACAALAVVAGAAAARKGGGQSSLARRHVARPLTAQTAVTVSERQALRRARSDQWYSRLPARTPGAVEPLQPIGTAEAQSGSVFVARGRTPLLWSGEGDLRPSSAGGPLSRLDYSAYVLPALVRKNAGGTGLLASLATLPARGIERVQPANAARAVAARAVRARVPILAEPDPVPPPPVRPVEVAIPERAASDAAQKAASVAILRGLADALSAQRGMLAALFAEVDEDKSVSLDKDELREMITQKLGVELGDGEMEVIWSQLDADGSGDIDLLEFMSWVQHMAATPTGVTPNMVWYYKEQAARGNSAAILNLAVCHLSGVGMLKDSTAGVALMRDAASRGNAMAAHSLGLCCWTGEGTAVDLDEAHKWLSKAAGQGVVMAAESLELLEQEREKQAKK